MRRILQFLKWIMFFLPVLLGKNSAALEHKTENSFLAVGVGLFHNTLSHSKSLKNWPFLFFPCPWGLSHQQFWRLPFTEEKPEENEQSPFNLLGRFAGTVSLIDLSVEGELGLQLTPLLTLGTGLKLGTAWNWSEDSIAIGRYRPQIKEYKADTSFSGMSYVWQSDVKAALPLGFLLSSLFQVDALKLIFLTGSYGVQQVQYTNARDGELWRVGMMGEETNGWQYEAGFGLGWAMQLRYLKFAAINFRARGYFKGNKLDNAYSQSGIHDTQYSITPMLMSSFGEDRHRLMAMFPVLYDANFKGDYSYEDRPLLEKTGREWRLKGFFMIYSYKL